MSVEIETKTEYFKQYWDNEKTLLRVEGLRINDKWEGERRTYHKNGQINTISNCCNGKIEGEFTPLKI